MNTSMSRKAFLTNDGYLMWECPGCGSTHAVPVRNGLARDWDWNGSLDRPTLHPSVLVNKDHANPQVPLCHIFMKDGTIQFLADCTHALTGKTVPMEYAE